MGGPASYMSLQGRPGNTICGPQCRVFEPCETQMENRCSAESGPDSLKKPSVSCVSAPTFCRALLEELCIFYLSLEIRLDPDEIAGCAHRHTLSLTHTHTRIHTHNTNGPPSVTEKSAITEREGRDSWDLHMSLREETTSPTRPGSGNEPAVHGL